GLALVVGAIAVVPRLAGVERLQIGHIAITGINRPYTPMLVLVLLAIGRMALTFVVRVRPVDLEGRFRPLARAALAAFGTCLALMAPVLVGLGQRAAE